MTTQSSFGLAFIDVDPIPPSMSHATDSIDRKYIARYSLELTLSDALVHAARSSDSEVWIADDGARGLNLRIRPSGSKSFYLKYPHTGRGAPRHEFLGVVVDYTLAEARLKAKKLLNQYYESGFPKKQPARISCRTSIEMLFRLYDAEVLTGFSTGWAQTVRDLFNRYVIPKFGDRLTRSVSRNDWISLTETLALTQPSRGNNLHKAAASFLSWSVKRNVLEYNPMSKTALPAPPSGKRRYLSLDKIVRIYDAAETLGPPWNAIIRLVILTGESGEDIRRLKQDQINWQSRYWRPESGVRHDTRLSSVAMGILAPYKTVVGYLFASPRYLIKPQPIELRTDILKRLEILSQAGDWDLRDLRRSINDYIKTTDSNPNCGDQLECWSQKLQSKSAELRQNVVI